MASEPAPPQVSPDGRFYWDGTGWRPFGTHSTPVNRIPGGLLVTGGSLILVGAFLPWLSAAAPLIGTVNRSLVDGGGDGPILVIAGAVAALLGLVAAIRGPARWAGGAAIFPMVVAVLVTVVDYSDIAHRVANLTTGGTSIIASVGAGPYVSALGIILCGGAVLMLLTRRGANPA